MLASLGCGNSTALAELKAGETVLDLGFGGGIDVLLSAKRGGPRCTRLWLPSRMPRVNPPNLSGRKPARASES